MAAQEQELVSLGRASGNSISIDNPAAQGNAKPDPKGSSPAVRSPAAVAPSPDEVSATGAAEEAKSQPQEEPLDDSGNNSDARAKRSRSRGASQGKRRRSTRSRIMNSYGSSRSREMSVNDDDNDGQMPGVIRAVSMSDAKIIDQHKRGRERLNAIVMVLTLLLILIQMLVHLPPILGAVQKAVPAWDGLRDFEVNMFFGLLVGEVVVIWLIGGVALILGIIELYLICGQGRSAHVRRTVARHWDNLDSTVRGKILKTESMNQAEGSASSSHHHASDDVSTRQVLEDLENQGGEAPIPKFHVPSAAEAEGNKNVTTKLKKHKSIRKVKGWIHEFNAFRDHWSYTGDWFFEKECLVTFVNVLFQLYNLDDFGENGVKFGSLILFSVILSLRSMLPLVLLFNRTEHIFLMHLYVVIKFLFSFFFSYFAVFYGLSVIISDLPNMKLFDIQTAPREQGMFTAVSIPALQRIFMAGGNNAWRAISKIIGNYGGLVFTIADLRDLDQLNILTTVAKLEKIEIDFHLKRTRTRVVTLSIIALTGIVTLVVTVVGISNAACTTPVWERICPLPARRFYLGLQQAFSPVPAESRSCPCSVVKLFDEPIIGGNSSVPSLLELFEDHGTYLQGVVAENSTIPVVTCIPDELITLQLFQTQLKEIKRCERKRGASEARSLILLKIYRAPELQNITGLGALTELRVGDFRETGLSDIEPMRHLTQFQDLILSTAKVTDVSPLAKATSLRGLDLNQNLIADISPLGALTNLMSLHAKRNNITDLSPLRHMKGLEVAELSDNYITDLSPLSELKELVQINVAGNVGVKSIEPLASLSNVVYLNLGLTSVNDVSPMTRSGSAKTLLHVFLYSTKLTSLPADTNKLSNLKDIDLGFTNITNLPDLTALKSLHSGIALDGNSFLCPSQGPSVVSGLPLCEGQRAEETAERVFAPCRNCTARCWHRCGNKQGNGILDPLACGHAECHGDGGDLYDTSNGANKGIYEIRRNPFYNKYGEL